MVGDLLLVFGALMVIAVCIAVVILLTIATTAVFAIMALLAAPFSRAAQKKDEKYFARK